MMTTSTGVHCQRPGLCSRVPAWLHEAANLPPPHTGPAPGPHHLALLGHLLDLRYCLLLLLLQAHALTVQLPYGLVKLPLVLTQQLCNRQRGAYGRLPAACRPRSPPRRAAPVLLPAGGRSPAGVFFFPNNASSILARRAALRLAVCRGRSRGCAVAQWVWVQPEEACVSRSRGLRAGAGGCVRVGCAPCVCVYCCGAGGGWKCRTQGLGGGGVSCALALSLDIHVYISASRRLSRCGQLKEGRKVACRRQAMEGA